MNPLPFPATENNQARRPKKLWRQWCAARYQEFLEEMNANRTQARSRYYVPQRQGF